MSETSCSLQVRTDAPEDCIALLRASGFNGTVFPGMKGWLTVVPYGGPEGIVMTNEAMARFSAKLAAPVLLYYANDFAWGFQVAVPDGRTTAFDCFFAELIELIAESGEQPAALDPAVVSGLIPQDWIDRLAQRQGLAPAEDEGAHRFARDMGFAEFIWLSPSYATNDPDEMLRRGGRDLGQRPETTPGLLF